jgi:ATP-binding cassette subfamily C protein
VRCNLLSKIGIPVLFDVVACSAAVNALALAGSAYAFVLYDKVIATGSGGSIAALTVLAAAVFALAGLLEFRRQRLIGSAARRLDAAAQQTVAAALSAKPSDRLAGPDAVRDLDRAHDFLTGPLPAALCDLPWMPLYIAALAILHPLLALLVLAGGGMMLAFGIVAGRRGRRALQEASEVAMCRWRAGQRARRYPETALHRRRWLALTDDLRRLQKDAPRPALYLAGFMRGLRPALQSGMLGLSGYLVITDQCSPAAMIAAVVLLSRALAPLDAIAVNWRGLSTGLQAVARIAPLAIAPQATVGRADQARRATSLGARSISSGLRPIPEYRKPAAWASSGE